RFSSVVLPDPEGPVTATASVFAACIVTPLIAQTWVVPLWKTRLTSPSAKARSGMMGETNQRQFNRPLPGHELGGALFDRRDPPEVARDMANLSVDRLPLEALTTTGS